MVSFNHEIKVYGDDKLWIGTLVLVDKKNGVPIAWNFRPDGSLLSQSEVEAIAAKLKELNAQQGEGEV